MLCVTRKRFRAGVTGRPVVARKVVDDQPTVVFTGVQSRPDGRGTDVQLAQLLRRRRHVVGSAAHALRVAAELLTERDRDRVLQVRAAGLQDVAELVRLARPGCRRDPGRPSPAAPDVISSASRVAVGNTSLVDWPMLT